MTTSAKQRQKQIEKRAKKRKLAKRSSGGGIRANQARAYLNLPIHECLVPSTLFETGLGTLLASRKIAAGQYAVSSFLVDVFCLGVKNAFFTVLDEAEYEEGLKREILLTLDGAELTLFHQTCFKKLVTGARRYADDLGFPPHPDYKGAIALLDDIDPAACPERFDYGQGGKPFYIRGPGESSSRAKRIVDQLERRCGPGNFHMLVTTGPID